MAERKNFSRYNMRCGLVLRAATGPAKLDGFEMPQLDGRFFCITAREIPGENAIRIMGTRIPLLADGCISYVGQPLLVLFGPDYESTELALEKIKVITTPFSEGEERSVEEAPSPLFFSWGLDNESETEKEKQTLRRVETTFSVKPSEIESYVRYSVLTWPENNGSWHIQCPMQWSELVKETVANSASVNPDSIVLHPEKYLARYDEFLATPAMFGAFTAIAAEKTKLACEMRPESRARRSGLDFFLTTWLDSDNKPRHEEITVTVNQGAFCVLGKEIQREIMTGIMPKYNLESFKAIIRTVQSPSMPTIFAGSSIYSSAVSAVAIHNSRLAERTLATPLSYAVNNCRDMTRFTDYAPKHDMTDLTERLKNVALLADFERKWSATSLHSGSFGLQGYLHGIGISSGLSISGFSTSGARDNTFQAQISYTQKKNITISGTLPSSITQDRTLRDLVSQYFVKNSASEPVLFLENHTKTPDSGPDILSSYQTVFLTQLMKAASKLSTLTLSGPVDLKFNSQNISMPCEFEYSGYGAAVCEMIIPKVSLIPVAKKVWLDLALALPYTRGAQQRIKSIATETLSSLGAKIADDFSVTVRLSGEKKDTSVYSSLENTTRLLVTSSYACALWQALGERNSLAVPSGAERIESILSGGKDK